MNAQIYYNNLIHGRIFQDQMSGDWMATFNDRTEQRVYKAR
jgi:hypothetical protein